MSWKNSKTLKSRNDQLVYASTPTHNYWLMVVNAYKRWEEAGLADEFDLLLEACPTHLLWWFARQVHDSFIPHLGERNMALAVWSPINERGAQRLCLTPMGRFVNKLRKCFGIQPLTFIAWGKYITPQ